MEITTNEGKSLSYIDLIEKFGFRANLFILCKYVGKRGFMDIKQLKDLQARGHKICFQTYSNPTSSQALTPFAKLGVKLLGEEGYNICPAGTITAQPSSTTLTWPNTHTSNGSADVVRPQGFPVYFEAAGLPPAITASKQYWLRRVNDNTCSVHLTEYDAADNVNAVVLNGCVPASLVIRYWNSSLGDSSIKEEFELGRKWMTDNGFIDCPAAYAPNQSSVNLLIEKAAISNGYTDIYTAGTPTGNGWTGLSIIGANYAWTDFGSKFRYNPKFTLNSCATAEAQSEEYMREFVRRCVQEGAISSDLVHNKGVEAVQSYVGYLDELKYQVSQGLAVYDTIDNVGPLIRSAQF